MNGDPDSRPRVRLRVLALSPGHGCADLSAASLFAVLPFLVVERRSLGVTACGIAQAAPDSRAAAPVLESREEMRFTVDR